MSGLAGALYRSSTAVVHEFMHTLGLPDLYRYMDQSAYPMGPWDIMDGGSVEAGAANPSCRTMLNLSNT